MCRSFIKHRYIHHTTHKYSDSRGEASIEIKCYKAALQIILFEKLMMSSVDRDWRLLPDLAVADIMLMVGLESLESLHRCRQVCRTWNEKIMTNIWGNRKNKEKMKAKIEKRSERSIKFAFL